MSRPTDALLLALAVSGGGCAYWWNEAEVESAQQYVASARRELGKGNVQLAADLLERARVRFRNDEAVLRWSIELRRMQGRDQEALRLLLELRRNDNLRSISRRELDGQIGELLFRLGKYSESAHFLHGGDSGPRAEQRRAVAGIAQLLGYVRPEPDYRPVETKLFGGTWPAMVCGFGDKQRLGLLDTGSSMCTLSKSFADEVGVAGLSEFGMVRDSLGEKCSAWIGVLPSLTIAGVGVGPLPVIVVEDERLALRDWYGGPDHAPSAIVGLDVLHAFRMVCDLPQHVARFERPRGLREPDTAACLFVDGCLLVPVEVDGVAMWFILDTAAGQSSLTDVGMRVLPGGAGRAIPDHRQARSLRGRGFIARKVVGLVLRVSAVKFANVELPVVERLSESSFPVHGVLGVDLLEHCRLTLDSGRMLLERITPATPSGRPR
ncbi:MAG: aspartyl protease family protein [Planctomycetes bacterium]|nr:aspartyl protease family protein [Planctomycetota bacterium]MCB9868880.1 aspartyl protease family protein [Planctomycetota bacterium]